MARTRTHDAARKTTAATLLLASVAFVTASLPARATRAAGLPGSNVPCATADAVDQARDALAAGDAARAVALLEAELSAGNQGTELHQVLGAAYEALGDKDRASHYFELAYRGLEPKTKEGREVLRKVLALDNLGARRRSFFKDSAKAFLDVAEKLYENEDVARAYEILKRIEPIVEDSAATRVAELLAEIRASKSEVDLDAAGSEERGEEALPLVRLESAHYKLECNLEPEVVQLVADTMDDIFGYYVLIYFDGDEGKVAGTPKATIRIHPSKEAMLGNWQGDSKPEGWWSPGEWKVVTFDTRTSGARSLDSMLGTLFHEASHQFMTMIAKGGNTPAWLNEGTASFFEGATAMADHRVLWPDAAQGRLWSLYQQLRSPMAGTPTVEQVVSYQEPGSYPGEYYSFGWGLVYFLQQYEDPKTLEYVLRPSYSDYRERITKRGGDSMETFKEVFIGPKKPGGWEDFETFKRFWIDWIRQEVYPLHKGSDRRALRMQKVAAYIAAADAKVKGAVPEEELLRRTLGHLEYVRMDIDDPEEPDPELLILQADVLERLKRPKAAAPLLERALDLADEGAWDPGEERYAALDERLGKLDAKNRDLRLAKSRIKNLGKRARELLGRYQAQDELLLLRTLTFCETASRALGGEPELDAALVDLRQQARAAGLLRGSVITVGGKLEDWVTMFSADELAELNVETGRVGLESMRAIGFLCTAFEVTGEYELRFRLRREGEIKRSTFHGAIVAGREGGESTWIAAGVDGKGRLVLRRATPSPGGGTSEQGYKLIDLDEPVAPDEHPRMVVRVFPSGRLLVTIGDRAPLEVELEDELPKKGHVGIYVRGALAILEDFVVETF